MQSEDFSYCTCVLCHAPESSQMRWENQTPCQFKECDMGVKVQDSKIFCNYLKMTFTLLVTLIISTDFFEQVK